MDKFKPHQIVLILAIGMSLLFRLMVPLQILYVPLQFLNTHVHEAFHALAAVVTGGQVQHILVRPDGSGVTPVADGWMVIIASAGYLGASAFGAAMVAGSRSDNGSRTMLMAAAALLGVSLILWVRGEAAGVGWAIGWIATLTLLAFTTQGGTLHFAGQFLGIQQCVNSIESVLVVFRISFAEAGHSDAAILGEMTALPAPVWAFGWLILSVALVTVALRAAWQAELKA